jgi:hypothetical protein
MSKADTMAKILDTFRYSLYTPLSPLYFTYIQINFVIFINFYNHRAISAIGRIFKGTIQRCKTDIFFKTVFGTTLHRNLIN